jgi:hypothetical protein
MKHSIHNCLNKRCFSVSILAALVITMVLVVAANGLSSYRFTDKPPVTKLSGGMLMYYRASSHSSQPVNFLDPYDSFQKDENGDLLITATGTNRFSAYTRTEFRGYALKTNRGTPVTVYQATPPRRWRHKANCYGYTFLDSDFWLVGADVEKILDDNGWAIVDGEDARAGDVAIYRDSDAIIVHSARVVGRDLNGHVLVDSKDGYDKDIKAVWAEALSP